MFSCNFHVFGPFIGYINVCAYTILCLLLLAPCSVYVAIITQVTIISGYYHSYQDIFILSQSRKSKHGIFE